MKPNEARMVEEIMVAHCEATNLIATLTERLRVAEEENERLRKRVETLERMDREAGQYVESVIALRTRFTGEPPYVGWKGLGLALTETLNDYEMEIVKRGQAEAALALIRGEG